MFTYSKKLWRGMCTGPTSHESRTFQWVGAACSRVDPVQGALELPETWEIGGPTRPQAHLSQSAYANRFNHPCMASISTNDGHLIGALGVSGHQILQKI